MNTFFRFSVSVFLFAALSLSVFAHTPMRKSSPANNDVLTESPQEISLQFGAPVKLIGLVVNSANGNKTVLSPNNDEAQREFVLPIQKLEDGNYTIEWSALGGDAHRLTGKIQFSINSAKVATE